jgi:hypothetical protein
MQTLGGLRNHYQGVIDQKKKDFGKPTRRRHVHMHTREGGGINSEKVADLTNNWSFQSPLALENGEDVEMMGLEDTTIEELEAEFNLLQTESASDPPSASQQTGPLSVKTPPSTAKLHDLYNIKEIDAIRKGITPQSARRTRRSTIKLSNPVPGTLPTFFEATRCSRDKSI